MSDQPVFRKQKGVKTQPATPARKAGGKVHNKGTPIGLRQLRLVRKLRF